jgi:hypothetical protein
MWYEYNLTTAQEHDDMDNGNSSGALIPAGQTNPAMTSGGGTRQGFGELTTQRGTQTQSDALAAQAKAAIEARYILAMRRPRDIDTVRAVLVRECSRPSFADEARYSVQRGKKQNDRGQWVDNFIEGPSIRFAEAAARAMGNMLPETYVVYDDADIRQLRVSVTDLEANLTYTQDIMVTKTVERKQLRQGQVAKATRRNSYGDVVYMVEASDDDLQNKQQALISKAMRTLILRLVPGDIIEESMNRCVNTIQDRTAKDPDAERKRLCDAYMNMGVTPEQLALYLGHPLAQTIPAELAQLRSLFAAIRDGQTTWVDAFEERTEGAPAPVAAAAAVAQQDDAQAAPAPAATPAAGRGTQAVKESLKDKKPGKPAPPAAADDPMAEPEWFRGAPPPVDTGGRRG